MTSHLLNAPYDVDYTKAQRAYFLCGVFAGDVGYNEWAFLDSFPRWLQRNNINDAIWNRHWCGECLSKLPAEFQMKILARVEL